MGYVAAVCTGYYGRGCTVRAVPVSAALTAIGQTIALAVGVNPTKLYGTESKLLPRLSKMLDGWLKDDPPPMKKLSAESNVPEYLCQVGQSRMATPLESAGGDLALIAFYYFLRVGEYTTKGMELFQTNSPVQTRGHHIFPVKITQEICANLDITPRRI